MRDKLTKVLVDNAKPADKPYEIHDDGLRGLLLRVQPSGIKSYVVTWGRGKRRTLGRHPVMTVAGARNAALSALAESAEHGAPLVVLEARKPVQSDSDTVADACRDYVAALAKDRRATAAQDAGRRFERTIYGDPLGSMLLAELTQEQLEEWRDRVESGDLAGLVATKGRSPTPKPLSKASVNRIRTPLIAALNRAVSRRRVAPDRAFEWQNVKPYSGTGQRRELYLDREQRQALLTHAGPDLRDVMTCILLTGCRPGDPAAMVRGDYDDRQGVATFRTKGHTRTVPLTPAAQNLFDRLAKGKAGRDYLFTNAGARWRAHDWSALVTAAAVDAGLPAEVVLYTLRHCWITDAIVGGLDLLTVTKLAGTSLAMVEKHYGHLVQSSARDKLAAVQFL